MNYSEILRNLEGASLFDLYRLKIALDVCLEQPDKVLAVKRQLRVGMEISYFSARFNKMADAVIEGIQRNCVYATDKGSGKRWSVPFYAINLAHVNTDINFSTNQNALDRNQLHVGENIGFIGKNDQEMYGIITQLNPKTASITAKDDSRWRVDYRYLFQILDTHAQEFSSQNIIEVTQK